jgi:hypothetical protein
VDTEARVAVERLFALAEGNTGGSRPAANFLLAWWNAHDLGGFDPTDLWALDERFGGDILIALNFMRLNREYPTALGIKEERIISLVERWRPEVIARARGS